MIIDYRGLNKNTIHKKVCCYHIILQPAVSDVSFACYLTVDSQIILAFQHFCWRNKYQ